MSDASQQQRGGHGSTNIQVFNEGLNAESRALVLDIVQAELYRYRQSAEAEVTARMERIAQRVVERVAKAGPAAIESFKDPDVQFSVGAVGRAYARTGDDDLATVLVDLLADRCDVSGRTLMAVVLNDAIETAAKLTDAELASLSVSWRLLHTRWMGMSDIDALKRFVQNEIAPFVDALPDGTASQLHMQYLGCMVPTPGEASLASVFRSAYPGVYTKGFDWDEIDAGLSVTLGDLAPRSLEEPGPFFIPCLREPSRLQVNALVEEHVESTAEAHGLQEAVPGLKQLLVRNQCADEEVLAELRSAHPSMEDLQAKWISAHMGAATLTSVGMAIAHSNYRRVTGMETPLTVWVS